ncbi:MAG: 16S rRNA (guanine(527)-N(7))-methyltransferase RsmG [Leptolyngbyaceae cyanobacterium]
MTVGEPAPSPLLDYEPQWQQTLQWQPTPEQQTLFQRVYEAILQGNQQMNLTRLTDPDTFWEKHLWDSLSGLAPWLTSIGAPAWATARATARVIDIGTGAGFPGLPAAIAFESWQITLLDATQKKVRFLTESAESIGLKNVRAIADRAEFLAHQPSHREQYDLALLRAVGPVPTCLEYALPLVKVGGVAVLYRGQWSDEDSRNTAAVAQQLGGKLLSVASSQTPLTQGVRHCVYVGKHTLTNEDFPRLPGIPAKLPLTPQN